MAAMSERTSRGYMVQSTISFIDKTYDPEARAKINAFVPERVRQAFANLNKVGWYPVEDVAELYRAIALYHRETDGNELKALENVGRSIAETATNTFLKLILRVLTPGLFASKMGDFWQRDNRCGTLQCIKYEPGENRMIVTLTGVKGYDFIGPVAPGFILFAFKALGFKDGRVSFPWDPANPGPDAFEYDFRWD